jgi:hypothetical protein
VRIKDFAIRTKKDQSALVTFRYDFITQQHPMLRTWGRQNGMNATSEVKQEEVMRERIVNSEDGRGFLRHWRTEVLEKLDFAKKRPLTALCWVLMFCGTVGWASVGRVLASPILYQVLTSFVLIYSCLIAWRLVKSFTLTSLCLGSAQLIFVGVVAAITGRADGVVLMIAILNVILAFAAILLGIGFLLWGAVMVGIISYFVESSIRQSLDERGSSRGSENTPSQATSPDTLVCRNAAEPKSLGS